MDWSSVLKKMDWSNVLSSIVSGSASLISGLFGAKQQSRNIDKQISAQQVENQKNREYNLDLAKKQNEWSIDQWNRENQYNTPSAQMSRLIKAGLNPDLIYSNGTSGLTSASSPTMTSGAPSQPVDLSNLANKPTVGHVVQQSLNDALLGAQTRLIGAQAKKLESETEGQDIHNKNVFELDRAQLENLLSQKDLNRQQIDESISCIEQTKTSIEQIKANIDLIGAQIENLSFSQAQDAIRLSLERSRNDAEVKKMQSEARLTDEQVNRLIQLLPHEIANMIADKKLTYENMYKVISDKMLNWATTAGVKQQNIIRSLDVYNVSKILEGSGKDVIALFNYAGSIISSIIPVLGKIQVNQGR